MILLNYPKYVGGKFISNCLALSRHCVVQHKQIAQLDINMTKFDDTYYKFKLATVLKTIPPDNSMVRWRFYEYGCKELYGVDEEFYQYRSIKEIQDYFNTNAIVQKINQAGKTSCSISHDYQTFLKYMLAHHGAKVIEFDNFTHFRAMAALLKDPHPEHVGDDDFISGGKTYDRFREFYKLDAFIINVDDTFFEWDRFNTMMAELYDYVEFDDYRPELVKQFWERYRALHKGFEFDVRDNLVVDNN